MEWSVGPVVEYVPQQLILVLPLDDPPHESVVSAYALLSLFVFTFCVTLACMNVRPQSVPLVNEKA